MENGTVWRILTLKDGGEVKEKPEGVYTRSMTAASDSSARVLRYDFARSALGLVLGVVGPDGICAIALGDAPAPLLAEVGRDFPRATLAPADREGLPWPAAVVALVEGHAPGQVLPLAPGGTPFQRRVWQALGDIPRGQTLSYRELAARIGYPAAARAVAGACAANRLAVAVPCHRVIGADGGLAGYRWGIERKRQLLAAEGLRA
jgi:AraC family transcriptional regulator of adaptative response/methylated-DNA-[protein]-cysteine methyltransferase